MSECEHRVSSVLEFTPTVSRGSLLPKTVYTVTTTQAFATFKASWFNQYDVITNTQPHAMQSSSAKAVVAPPLTISVETLKKGP